MFRSLLLSLFIVFSFSSVYSQTDNHRLTEADKLLLPGYMQSRAALRSTASIVPPTSAVRTIGEWEELQALIVTWTSYTTMIREIIRAASLETTVIVITNNPASVYSTLLASGIDTANVECLNIPYNTVWSRDYGPWSAYTNDVDSLITIDWIYNRPRPNDDQIPVYISNYLNTPLYSTSTSPWDLVHTGGNFMTDGFGTGFSSDLILDENSPSGGFGVNHTPAEVDTIMNRFMGINRYIRFPTLPYDQIHHIDMHLKLLDEETLLVGQYPAGVADGPQIEANLQYILNNYNSVYGTPYKVVRIPMPADNGLYPSNGGDYLTYTNSSFINKTLIVPTYGIAADTTALRIYQDALPGYTITGINSTASIGALGALHCITKEIGTNDPLLISCQPLPDTVNTTMSYVLNPRIQHRSGIQQAYIYWRTDTVMPFDSIALSNVSGYTYTGVIPALPAGTVVYYYIGATSVSGKHQVRPMPAPTGTWKFVVGTPAAVATITKDEMLPVFPNTSKGITCIPLKLSASTHAVAVLFDMQGRKVMDIFNGNLAGGEQKLFMNTSMLSSGIYELEVLTENGRFTSRIAVR